MATANTFARESHVDELADALGADPLAFRLANLADERLATVLRTVAQVGGWRASAGGGAGTGIAVGTEKGGRVATLARVHLDGGAVVLGLVDRPDLPPAGGGETPIIALAPAIANAIHAACGIRVRSLPLLDGAGRPRDGM